jgi:hypothetical protein
MGTSLIDRYQPRWLYLDEFAASLPGDDIADKREAILLLIRDRLIVDGGLNERQFRFLGDKPDALEASWLAGIELDALDWQQSWLLAPSVVHENETLPFAASRQWLLIEIAAECLQLFGAPISVATGKRKRKTPVKEKRAEQAIQAIFKGKIPTVIEVTNPELNERVNKWLKDNTIGPVSLDSVLRAAGRRSKSRK